MCDCKVKSTSVVLEQKKRLVINIPTPCIVKNMSEYCLIICQSIPCKATTEPVVLCWPNGVVVNLMGIRGNYVRADQLKSRTCYPIVFGTDPIHYSLTRPIPCSSMIYSVSSLKGEPIVSTFIEESILEDEQ